MSPIPDEIIEQVRDAADIVSLIGEQVDLKRTGADYRGPCPFHGGENRNLAVIPRKQMFYCFVCHEAGDVFTYFMKREGLDYPAAVRLVAGAVGITIPERRTAGPDPNEPLYDAAALACDWYARELRENEAAAGARAYLLGRGFDVAKHPELGFGFAAKGDRFTEGMHKLGLSDEVMLDAGLLVRREDGSLRPRFWNRLLIPIRDLRGRVVGFGGRILGDGEPKYLNSSDNRIFHKGRLLYNLDHAKQAIRRKEGAIVVEGYFDVLKLVEVGVDNVVASLGTAFTAEQATLLGRYARDVTILYDSDRAGLKATFRAADMLLAAGLRVMVATLPEGEDPDTLAVSGGAKAIEKVVADALDVCERKIQLMERAGLLATVPGRRKALDKLLPTLRATRDPVTRDLYISLASQALGTSRESVAREVDRRSAATRIPRSGAPVGGPLPGPVGHAERTLITILVKEPSWRGRVGELVPGMPIPEPALEVIMALSGLAEDGTVAELLETLSPEARATLAPLMGEPGPTAESVDTMVEESLATIEARSREQAIRQIDREIPLLSGDEKDARLRDKKALIAAPQHKQSKKWKLH